MVLGKLPVPGRPTTWIIVRQGPTALAVGAGGGCLDIFTLIYPFFPLSPSLWETARYRLKYCLKGPLNPKQPTNQRLPKRGRKKGKGQMRVKISIPPPPTASAIGLCPTGIKIIGRLGTGSLPSTIATRKVWSGKGDPSFTAIRVKFYQHFSALVLQCLPIAGVVGWCDGAG